MKPFQNDPYHSDLYNHPLIGQWKGFRSISFGGDWRAHYEMLDKDTAQFAAIGTHAQLYR
ncbi:MAG TPA: type II toxin-antitoxin system mRNA interferase toxin, RelE/StbE family [Candidatus Limnocylindria bacterium]|nr:type II toxin-antitoxin system mRNA interferase toxin, RelE/StbE family [Candidatus Limnocylindria bacterium]